MTFCVIGKTLGFNLACENLRGPCLNHSTAFQHLKKATKFTYQCSTTSSGPEIGARFKDAYARQNDLDTRQYGKHVCVVGVDEAGLTPENRQALKSLHDYLGTLVIYLRRYSMLMYTVYLSGRRSRRERYFDEQHDTRRGQDLASHPATADLSRSAGP